MTKYDFLTKARELHGYKYTYPNLSSKISSNDNIDILYNDTLYNQKVCKHFMGRCPEKNTPSRTTEEFIEQSIKIWSDKYDYSLVEYKGALEKVKIIFEGIVFEQIASSHLLGMAPELKMNKEFFIKRAIDKWKDKYDYSLVKYIHSKKKVKIILRETGEIFEQSPSNHLISSPEKKLVKGSTESFIERSNKIHDNRYDYSKVKYTISREKVRIICKKHGEFDQVANSHLMGMGCKKCGDEENDREYEPKYTTKEFISESISKWGDKYDYSLVNYVNCRTRIKIIFDGIVYEQTPLLHLKYPPERFLNQEIFLIKSKRKWGDKYDYSLVNYISTKIPVKIIYQGQIYEQLPHNHLTYAPELRNKMTLEDFIISSEDIHNKKYNYDNVIYVNDKNKVIITCPIHGQFKQTPSVHLRGSGCKRCSDSFGEKEISKFLEKNSIEHIREHRFIDCVNIHPLRFDFYIPSRRTCIEFDGIQHYQPVEYFGGQKAYEKAKINDKIKNDYCEDNYINLIRIRWDQIDDIQQILLNNFK